MRDTSRRRLLCPVLLTVLALLLASCASDPPPPPATLNDRPPEWLQFESDGRDWRLVEADRQPAFYIEILALPTGSVEPVRNPGVATFNSPAPPTRSDRSLLVERRLVFVPGGGSDRVVQDEIDSVRTMVGSCAASDFKILARGPGDAFIEWSHSGCANRAPEHEIARMVEGSLGLHRAALRGQGGRIPQRVRRDWIRLLAQARLTGVR